MDPSDPLDAQQIFVEYARVLERDIDEQRHPARLDSLPFSKSIIQAAIRTSVTHLLFSGQLTTELREYFESAYTSLAEYLDPELVALMSEYRRSAEQLTSASVAVRDRTATAAWRTVAESSALAGEVARATSLEAERLKSEFQELVRSV